MAAPKDTGYVKMHRSIAEWGWYTDVPTKVVFLHLLVTANWKPGMFLGFQVEPGSTVTSHQQIADGCGLTLKQVRRAVENLKATGEIVVSGAGRGQLVTLTGWAMYQIDASTGAASGQDEGSFRAASGQLRGNYQRREESKKGRREEGNSASRRASMTLDQFRDECRKVVEADPTRMPESERKAFFDYWTERDLKSGKMRFEAERFFDIGRRMDTWRNRYEERQARMPGVNRSLPRSTEPDIAAPVTLGQAWRKMRNGQPTNTTPETT